MVRLDCVPLSPNRKPKADRQKSALSKKNDLNGGFGIQNSGIRPAGLPARVALNLELSGYVVKIISKMGTSDHLGLNRLELQVTAGTGKLSISGSGVNAKSKEAIKIAFDYFKANIARVSSLSKVGDHDYHLHIVEIHNTGAAGALTLCSFVSFCSGLMSRPL
jgi:predicted ATP-dependent Lon-type protease